MDLVVNTPVDDEVTTNTFTARGVSRNMDLGGVKGWGLVPPSSPFRLIPPPPLPLPLPIPSRPLPLEVGPINPARGLGERCMLPQPKLNLVHFSLKI